MASRGGPRPVTVEDYHSDDGSPDRTTHGNSARANARREQSGNGPTDPEVGGGPASDSGYSSHAAATAASFDSPNINNIKPIDRHQTSMNPPPAPDDSPIQPRRPAPYGFTPSRPKTKPERPNVVRAGHSSESRSRHKAAASDRHRTCDCLDCRPRSKRDSMSPLETAWDVDFTEFYQPNTRRRGHYVDEPAPYSAGSSRYPDEEWMASAAAAAARPRPNVSRSRPMSYHAGVSPSPHEMYYDSLYASTYAGDHGPPPATSAYTNPPMSAHTPLPHSVSLPPYYSHPMEYTYPDMYSYESSRPAMPQRSATERRASSRPASMYGAPVIHDEYPPPSSTYVPSASRRPAARDSGDFSQYRPTYQERERAQLQRDAQAMPPPSSKPSRRPSLRQSRTSHSTQDVPRSATATAPSDAGATVMGETYGRPSSRRESSTQRRSSSRRPSFPSESGERRSSKTYSDGSGHVQVESSSRHRRSSYYDPPRSPEKTRNLERSAEEYQNARSRATPSQPLTNEALHQQQKTRRPVGSSSGSHSRASGSLDGSEVKPRSGTAATASVPDSDDGITMRFTPGTDVKLDFTGGMNGRTISLKPGQTGEQAELSIKSRKGYENRSTGTHSEYARSDHRRREVDDGGRRTRDGRSSNHSRRASRSSRDHHPAY